MAPDSPLPMQASQPKQSSAFTGSDFPSTSSSIEAGQLTTHTSQPVLVYADFKQLVPLGLVGSSLAARSYFVHPLGAAAAAVRQLISDYALTAAKLPINRMVSIFFCIFSTYSAPKKLR